ncbi:hypothetical protein GQ43DRAFT_435543 [Delitschia confertaspora ATCC 74209]|uniref:Uncharacterized protein n=1 Tax=Delitschia confertaspora ATCC 74209 TaxID=1513339 RepID=A0A9P4JCK5_9PLEO|nr:hypothetical protein GQ43DRAFT_435543 [Delitschia confertaspora ATCC 74209]
MKVEYIPPPSARELLPPLLACLSNASTSKQPPPGLLPLLSPILRQRVQLLSSDTWLPLLSWDAAVGSKLEQIANNIHLEPHPVSGEVEIEEPDTILYRRSDPETLHSRLSLSEFGLIIIYLWCTGGEGGNAWKLSELRGSEDGEDGTEWYTTIEEANERGFRRKSASALAATTANGNGAPTHISLPVQPQAPQIQADKEDEEDEEDDDAYWAAYDRTPGRTPQAKRSPAPVNPSTRNLLPSQSELEYFARYAAEVQPALDAHDPDEETPEVGESTLNGNTLDLQQKPEQEAQTLETFPSPWFMGTDLNGHEGFKREDIDNATRFAALSHPRPSSAASSSSVEKLERQAEKNSQAELAIKQHISTDIKSLFRLARSAGIELEEFERIIRRELEVLPMLDRDE